MKFYYMHVLTVIVKKTTGFLSLPLTSVCLTCFPTLCNILTVNNKVNHLHERCLRIVHSDKTSSFEKLLEKMDLSPHILEIFKLLRQKCLRFTRICHYQ